MHFRQSKIPNKTAKISLSFDLQKCVSLVQRTKLNRIFFSVFDAAYPKLIEAIDVEQQQLMQQPKNFISAIQNQIK